MGGILHAALILTHPGYGMYATMFLGLYVGLRHLERSRTAVLWSGGILVGVGLFLSSPHTVPMMVEQASTRLSLGWSLASDVGPTLSHLLGWSNYRFWLLPIPPELQHWYGGYLGLTLVTVALIGFVYCISRIQADMP